MTDNSEEDEYPHFDAEEETVTDAWKGTFLVCSWGYGQTNVNFARIIDVSDSGKTVLCEMVKAERVSSDHGQTQLSPTPDQYGDSFRLHVRGSRGSPSFRGSYPFVSGDKEDGTRRDTFLPHDNTPGKTYRETASTHGH